MLLFLLFGYCFRISPKCVRSDVLVQAFVCWERWADMDNNSFWYQTADAPAVCLAIGQLVSVYRE